MNFHYFFFQAKYNFSVLCACSVPLVGADVGVLCEQIWACNFAELNSKWNSYAQNSRSALLAKDCCRELDDVSSWSRFWIGLRSLRESCFFLVFFSFFFGFVSCFFVFVFFSVKILHLQCLDWCNPSYCLLSLKRFLLTNFCTVSFTGEFGLEYFYLFIYLFYCLGNVCQNIKSNIWMNWIVENFKFLLLRIVEILQFVQSELDVKKCKVYLVWTRFPKDVFRAAILTLVILMCNWICFCEEK